MRGLRSLKNNSGQWPVPGRQQPGSLNSPVSRIAQDFASRPQLLVLSKRSRRARRTAPASTPSPSDFRQQWQGVAPVFHGSEGVLTAPPPPAKNRPRTGVQVYAG